jgi:hypothetical protein
MKFKTEASRTATKSTSPFGLEIMVLIVNEPASAVAKFEGGLHFWKTDSNIHFMWLLSFGHVQCKQC